MRVLVIMSLEPVVHHSGGTVAVRFGIRQTDSDQWWGGSEETRLSQLGNEVRLTGDGPR